MNAEQRAAVEHGDGPLMVGGRGHRQDAGARPPHRGLVERGIAPWRSSR